MAFLNSSNVPAALYALVNTLVGLDEMMYCAKSHSFWGGQLHCTTQFAMAEMRSQPSQGQVQFGGSATFKIPRAGDQVYWMYAIVRLPGIVGVAAEGQSGVQRFPTVDDLCDDNAALGGSKEAFGRRQEVAQAGLDFLFDGDGDDHIRPEEADYAGMKDEAGDVGKKMPSDLPNWAVWTNAVGHALIQEADFEIGSQRIASVYSEYLFAHEELAGKPGKRLEEMIGKRKESEELMDNLIVDSMQTRNLYVPLPFWFTRAPAHALSMLHLSLSVAKVEMQFEKLENLIIVRGEDTRVQKWDGNELRNDDLDVVLSTTHVWLPKPERARLTQHGNEKIQIIYQVQRHQEAITSARHPIRLDFNMPSQHLMFFGRRRCATLANDRFNFSGVGGLDLVESMELKVNNNILVNETEGSYFRLVQPYQHHTVQPNAMVYSHSFALFPNEMIISGSINFSRFDSIIMNVRLQEAAVSSSSPVDFFVFAPNWNVVRYKEGGATLIFT